MSGPDMPKRDSEKAQLTMEPNSEHQTKTEGVTANLTAIEEHETCATSAPTPTSTPTPTPNLNQNATVSARRQSDFIFGKCIGEGSFSTVYLGTDKDTRREYAIKVCDKRHILRENKQEYVRREREVLQIMNNVPGFVKLMCTFQDSRSLYFVITYAQNGELLPHIKRVGCFSTECARHYAAELVLACEQMHRRRIVHRDLKPENILLDKHMHTLIADFGSAKVLTTEDVAASSESLPIQSETQELTDDDSDDLRNESSVDELDAFYRPPEFRHKRKGSFVGTAQYVSPEVLKNAPISPAADLWAIGCILYQMISGLPPFRGYNDFAVFKEILACKLVFPENFDKDAEDLVRHLLKVNPCERLGAQDDYINVGYISIRQHSFFEGIDFETIREQLPPKILPYLACVGKDSSESEITGTLPLELEKILSFSCSDIKAHRFDLTTDEKRRFLEEQKTDKWHPFADNEVILMKAFVKKHKGLFASKRMLILTTGPHLMYIDPVEMIKCGEIPWGPELRTEVGNTKVLFVHASDRIYFFDTLELNASIWASAITSVHSLTYNGSS